jgi:DNA-binding NarL/FixJ family response regulator
MNFLMQSTVPGEAPSGVERSAASVLSRLTPREQQVAWLVSYGETSKSIGRELGISFRTVEVHRAKIMTKLGVHSLAELVRLIGRWPTPEPSRHPLPGSQA